MDCKNQVLYKLKWNLSTHILQLGSNTRPLFMREYFGTPALPFLSEIPLATVANVACGDHLNFFVCFCTTLLIAACQIDETSASLVFLCRNFPSFLLSKHHRWSLFQLLPRLSECLNNRGRIQYCSSSKLTMHEENILSEETNRLLLEGASCTFSYCNVQRCSAGISDYLANQTKISF